jgi:integrase
VEPEEVELFLSSAKEYCPDYHPLFLIALRAGLRQGEILGLKWGDFQFGRDEDDTNRYILVQRRWYRGTFGTPKGGKARRVDMSRELRGVLLQLRSDRLQESSRQGRASIARRSLVSGRQQQSTPCSQAPGELLCSPASARRATPVSLSRPPSACRLPDYADSSQLVFFLLTFGAEIRALTVI